MIISYITIIRVKIDNLIFEHETRLLDTKSDRPINFNLN